MPGKKTFIISYLIVLLLKVVTSHAVVHIKLIQFLLLIIIWAIGVMSSKGNKIATITIGILIFITGLASLTISFLIGSQQIVLRIIFIILGCYFFIGGAVVLKRDGIRDVPLEY